MPPLLLVRLGQEPVGILVQTLAEVSYIGPFLDQVPGLPKWFCGLTPLGREEAWVVDLGDYLGLGPTTSVRPRTALLVIRRQNQKIGFVVADLMGTREIAVEDLQPISSPASTRLNQRFLSGAAEIEGRLTLVLNLLALISDVEWDEITQALFSLASKT